MARFLLIAGGVPLGLGAAWLTVLLLESNSRWNVPALNFAAFGALAVLGYRALRDRVAPVHAASRAALVTAGSALFFTFCVQWEGHAGGYFQNSAMRAFLDELHDAQEGIRERTGSYAAVMPDEDLPFRGRLTDLNLQLTADGWTADVGLRRAPRRCAIYVGSTPHPPAREEGVVRCTRAPLPPGPALRALALIAGGIAIAALGLVRARA